MSPARRRERDRHGAQAHRSSRAAEGGGTPSGDSGGPGQPADPRLRRLRGHASGGGRETARRNPDAPSRRRDPRARVRRGERSGDGGSRCARAARASGGRDHPRDTPSQKSGWLRKNVVDRIRETAGSVPVEHVVVDLDAETGAKNVLVLANETVVGKAAARPNPRANARGSASFLIISPQSDPTQAEHPEAERRLRASPGRVARRGDRRTRPDSATRPVFGCDAMRFSEERVDEIIVSTFAPSRSPWLRKNLVQRLHDETKLPVEHIVFQPDQVEEGARA